MSPVLLVLLFAVSTAVGYLLLKNIPTLLHTPLMSGMNALSGLTVLGALIAAGAAIATYSRVLAFIAVFLAMINVACGFGVTHRMLRMFDKKERGK